MARTPRPWYRNDRRCWQVTIKGTRHTLAQGAKKDTKKAAERNFRKLMDAAEAEKPAFAAIVSDDPLMGELAVLHEEHLKSRESLAEIAPQAVSDFRRRIAGFVEVCGDTPAAQLKPHDVTTWIEGRKNAKARGETPLGPTTRHDAIAAVKGITAWAKRQGIIPIDPLADMKKPMRRKRAEFVMDSREVPAVLARIPPGPFLDLLRFLYLTGARPGEAMALEAKHVDLARSVVVMTKHKTRRKTDAARLIPLSPDALKLVKRLIKLNPEGAIFRNTKGAPWCKDSVSCAMRRLRRKLAIGDGFMAYALRHAWATDALRAGESPALVAEILGHADTRVLMQNYSHLIRHTDALIEVASRVRAKPKKPVAK